MPEPLIAAQVTPANLYLEGIEHVLDTLREKGAVNTLIPTTHTYWYGEGLQPGFDEESVGGLESRREAWPDHGVELQIPRERKERITWCSIPHEEREFAGTILRHLREPELEFFADRDLLAELAGPLRERGMRVYPRVMEGFGPGLARVMPNWLKVCVEDVYGRLKPLPCFNHPDYRNFWLSTVRDMFTRYELDGLLLGFERGGPLAPLLFHGQVPHCFCPHCVARAERMGVDPKRAREGMRQLFEFYERWSPEVLEPDEPNAPTDGFFLSVLRIVMRYPEILSWHRLEVESKKALEKSIYGTVKALKPQAEVGWFVPHYPLWHEIFNRADLDYGELSAFSDFLRPCIYYGVTGSRLKRSIDQSWKRWLGREFSEAGLRDAIFSIMGWSHAEEPDYEDMGDGELFSPSWAEREVSRCKAGVKPGVKVYPAVGMEFGPGVDRSKTDHDLLYRVVRSCFDAGADGLVVGRYYHDLSLAAIETSGRAIRDARSSARV